MSVPVGCTLESWAWELIHTESLAAKFDPPPPPREWEGDPIPRRVLRPGRPPELRVEGRARGAPRPGALRERRARADLLAILHHHEIQAAELFAWALLAFPAAPRRFRQGLVALAREELQHAALYRERLQAHGATPADFPVRDWFWVHVPRCESPTAFVALMGLGLEGGNLEHAARHAEALAAAGDPESAAVCRRVARDEEAHVRFAARWFRRLTGGLEFDRFREALPEPLTPTVLAGAQLARDARTRAGMSDAFLDQLEAWCRARPGS